MQAAFLVAGVAAWLAVGLVAIAMAEWVDSVIGLIVILLAVLLAWGIGEKVTATVWGDTER